MNNSDRKILDEIGKIANLLKFEAHNNTDSTYYIREDFLIYFKTKFNSHIDRITLMKKNGDLCASYEINDAIKEINKLFQKELREIKINKLLNE